jgi:signal transduction histidine kinase
VSGNQQKDAISLQQPNSRPTIGLVIGHLSDKNCTSIWQGVMDTAREQDANVLTFLARDLDTFVGFEAQANVLYDSEVVDQQLKILISDTGPGIPPDVMPHIFEPLYSTRGFGVGLGLPIVREVMKQHRGKIEITSEIEKGTQVILWLPLA